MPGLPCEGDDGGIAIANGGSITLAGETRIEGNSANQGGGIFVSPSATAAIGANCRVTGNTATDGLGGGIATDGNGSAILLNPVNPSPIVVDNCHENCVGNVPRCQSGGTCPPPC